jgi:hypothetical protein
VLDAEILVPYRKGLWLGWWARIRKRELVHRDMLANKLGTLPERHSALYYYILEFDEPREFGMPPSLKPPLIPGVPVVTSWHELAD